MPPATQRTLRVSSANAGPFRGLLSTSASAALLAAAYARRSFEDADGGDAGACLAWRDCEYSTPPRRFRSSQNRRTRSANRSSDAWRERKPRTHRTRHGATGGGRPARAVDPLADLVHRLTGADVQQCPRCQAGRMRATGVLAPTAGTTQAPPFADSS